MSGGASLRFCIFLKFLISPTPFTTNTHKRNTFSLYKPYTFLIKSVMEVEKWGWVFSKEGFNNCRNIHPFLITPINVSTLREMRQQKEVIWDLKRAPCSYADAPRQPLFSRQMKVHSSLVKCKGVAHGHVHANAISYILEEITICNVVWNYNL